MGCRGGGWTGYDGLHHVSFFKFPSALKFLFLFFIFFSLFSAPFRLSSLGGGKQFIIRGMQKKGNFLYPGTK